MTNPGTGLGNNPQAQHQHQHDHDWTVTMPSRPNHGPWILGAVLGAALIGASAAIWVNNNPAPSTSTSTVTTITGEDRTLDFKADQAEKNRIAEQKRAETPQRTIVTNQVDEAKPPRPEELFTDTSFSNWKDVNGSDREFTFFGQDPIDVTVPSGVKVTKPSNPLGFGPGAKLTLQTGDVIVFYGSAKFDSDN